MNVAILYAHPNPKSFNHAILEVVSEEFRRGGHTVEIRDLYAAGFDPALTGADFEAPGRPDVKAEQAVVSKADMLVFIHPIWWFSMPARLKGWIDRVFSYGFAYAYGPKGVDGLLKGKRAVIFNTTGGGQEAYDQGMRAAVETCIDKGTMNFTGMNVALHRFFYAVPSVTQEARAAMLEQARQDAAQLAKG